MENGTFTFPIRSYIANDSACVSNPDLAGPAAKSEAEIKWNCESIYQKLNQIQNMYIPANVKYLIRKRASPKHLLCESGSFDSRPRRSHSFTAHRSIASNKVDSSALMVSWLKINEKFVKMLQKWTSCYDYYLRTTQSVSQSISSKVVSLNISLEWVWMICKLFSSNTGSSNNLANS